MKQEDWTWAEELPCDGCEYKRVPIHANPCCNCVDSNKFKPENERKNGEIDVDA